MTAIAEKPATATKADAKAEARKQQAQEQHEKIIAQVEALRSSDEWQKFLDFTRSFHNYSLNNIFLILSQKSDATYVAGFKAWREKGRQVRKGEKSLKIFGFATKKLSVKETQDRLARGDRMEVDEEGRGLLKYFPVLSVFDISQTDPIEGAEEIPSNKQFVSVLEGQDGRGVTEAVRKWAESKGWAFDREELREGLNGYTSGDLKKIVVSSTIPDAQAAKTSLHEAAHAILHAGIDGEVAEDALAHRGISECEAEATAYVVAGMLGIDTSDYSTGYIAGWAGNADSETLKATAGNVVRAAHTIYEGIQENLIEE